LKRTEQCLEVERPTYFGVHKFLHFGRCTRLYELAKNALLFGGVDLPIGLDSIDHRLKNHYGLGLQLAFLSRIGRAPESQ
jgi:hypothetical protein